MSPLINFELVEDEGGDQPEPDDNTCQCEKPDSKYQMEIEEGQVSLVHTACGKPASSNWGDWQDLVFMNPIPVRVEWDSNCNGSLWHGDHMCDCDSWVQVTPDQQPEETR